MRRILLVPAILAAPLAIAATPVATTPAAPAEQEQVKAELGLSIDALVAALPACELSPGDGALDLQGGCVDGVCAADPAGTAIEVLEASCDQGSITPDGQLDCDTTDGIGFFDARTSERHPREDVHAWYLRAPYAGQSPSGLGIGVSLGCFVQELGTPTKVEIEREGDRFAITEVRFEEPRVWVQATGGLVHRIVLYAPKDTSRTPARPRSR